MSRHYWRFILQAALLLIIQAVVMNHIRLFNYFIPIIFLYPILKLPIQAPRWSIILLSALLGGSMDLLMNTPGLNMAVTALIGLIRAPILISFADEDLMEEEGSIIVPTNSSLSIKNYQLYLLIMLTTQIATLMLLEAFSTNIFLNLLPSILGSVFISYIIYLFLDLLLSKKISK